MNAPRIALAGAGARRSGLAPGASPRVGVDAPSFPDSANAPADARAPRVANGTEPSNPHARATVVAVVERVTGVDHAPFPAARFSTTAARAKDVDASALDRARPPTARHSLDAAPDMSTRRDETRGAVRCGVASRATTNGAEMDMSRVYDWRERKSSVATTNYAGRDVRRQDAAQSLEFVSVFVSTPRARVGVVGNVDGVGVVEIEPFLVGEDVVGVAV